MTGHSTFILLAYGFTALCVAGELLAITLRRRAAVDRAFREAEFDEDVR